jgi:hypothetical protein
LLEAIKLLIPVGEGASRAGVDQLGPWNGGGLSRHLCAGVTWRVWFDPRQQFGIGRRAPEFEAMVALEPQRNVGAVPLLEQDDAEPGIDVGLVVKNSDGSPPPRRRPPIPDPPAFRLRNSGNNARCRRPAPDRTP